MIETIRWDGSILWILDQTLLPHVVEYRRCSNVSEVADAIKTMQVRGAPAIGVTAAFGMVLAAFDAAGSQNCFDRLETAAEKLISTRPTAVNLMWAVHLMLKTAHSVPKDTLPQNMEAAAKKIYDDDIANCRQIGRFGAAFVPASATILTHCNAGALATAGYGTALGVIRAAVEQNKKIRVFADETRPFLQGSRLTAWELMEDGIDTTLITDNMAAYCMSQHEIDLVVVGADRIAANGDTANKIGTYSVALAAKAHNIPFYVAAPLSTIDRAIPDGKSIPIEERNPDEVTHIAKTLIAPAGVKVRNPAFDVTPNHLITAIITEKGAVKAPYNSSIHSLFI